MRETSFIDQNKEKWNEFEKEFENETDPEKVSNLFIQITDDLSYARTYYPNRSVKIYLNNLAQKVFQSIYRNKVRKRRNFQLFWTDELPQKMHESRWPLLFAFGLFMIAFLIGVFSSMHDPSFARFILGDTYVKMTETNIASGDPMKVYKEMNQFDMFFGITFNNLRVAFFTLVLGIFFGLGTSYFILYNGIMVGTFQYFFIERGLFWDSFLTIWVHGALEISAIVIAGAAGLTLGRGLLFPGTYTRLQSFRLNGLRAVQIFLGIAPIIVLAGINESFLTRYTETPDFIRAILIFVEFGFMLFYFVIYPNRKAKQGFNVKRKTDEIPATKPLAISLNKIKTNGAIFAESFSLFRQFFRPIFNTIVLTALLYTTGYFLLVTNFEEVFHQVQMVRAIAIGEAIQDNRDLLHYEGIFTTNLSGIIIGLSPSAFQMLLNAISLTVIFSLSLYLLQLVKQQSNKFIRLDFIKFIFTRGWYIFLICLSLHAILLLGSSFANFAFYVLFPLACFILTDMVNRKSLTVQSLGQAKTFVSQILNTALLYLPLLLLSVMMACISHSIIAYFNIELIKWNIPFNNLVYEGIQDVSMTFMLITTIFIQIAMVIVNMGLLYFTYKETTTATELKERIEILNNPGKKLSAT